MGLIGIKELCELLHITRQAVYWRMKNDKNFPKQRQFVKNGRLYFLLSEVKAYIGVKE